MIAKNRDLSALRLSGSTARVLNLVAVYQESGHTPEYAEKPLFHSERLNRSILLKHTLRSHERSLLPGRGSTATKVVLPFDPKNLDLGGYSVFVGEPNYEQRLRSFVGRDTTEDQHQADMEVLEVIDELPSFDPFLLRERLRRRGIEPARCYFGLSEADALRMRKFVQGEICRLVDLAFAGHADVRNMSGRLAEKLMTDETAASLEPLRTTLQLSGEEYREGVFAWKGFLYYSWVVMELGTGLQDLSKQILTARILRARSDERRQIDEDRRRIVRCLGASSAQVRDGIREYQRAYDELSKGKPSAFRDFLLRAPALFLSVGDSISVIKHIESYWSFRFGRRRADISIDVEEAQTLFQEFAAQLSGVEASAAPAAL